MNARFVPNVPAAARNCNAGREKRENQSGTGFSRLKIPRGHYLFEVSFVFRNKALFAKHRAAIDSVVASLMVEPQGQVRRRLTPGVVFAPADSTLARA